MMGGFVEKNEYIPGTSQYRDTCALRMSYDLYASGWHIPKAAGTVSGGNKSQFYMTLPALQGYLTATFGKPQILPGGSFEGPPGKTGILIFKIAFGPGPGGSGASSGHGTLWNGSMVKDPEEHWPPQTYGRWPLPSSILFWEVK
jgi:hypothetical protein